MFNRSNDFNTTFSSYSPQFETGVFVIPSMDFSTEFDSVTNGNAIPYVVVTDDDKGNVKILGITVKDDFNGNVSLDDFNIIDGLNVYQGSHTAIPKVEEQTLETAEKYVMEDIQITAIPIYEVSNNAGGETFIIAKE